MSGPEARKAWLAEHVPEYADLSQREKRAANSRARYHTNPEYRARAKVYSVEANQRRREREARRVKRVLDRAWARFQGRLEKAPEQDVAAPLPRITCTTCGQRPSMAAMAQCAPCHAVQARSGRMVATRVA